VTLTEERPPPAPQPATTGRPRSHRSLLALILAVLAVVAAVLAAVGPAKHERSVYTWPPAELPAGQPQTAWYTPLLLTNLVPQSIEVRLPCDSPPVLPRADERPTMLATARRPERVDGLRIRRAGDELTVTVGRDTVSTLPVDCSTVLHLRDGRLAVGGRTVALNSSYPNHMPTVSGLFTQLDLRQTSGFRATVETLAYATSPTIAQSLARIIAALFAFAALALILPRNRRRSAGSPPHRPLSRALRAAGVVDAFVVGVLLAWWVLSPIFIDDGWVWVRQRTFGDVGAFTNYFDSYGANLPLVYWVEWLQHWIASSTGDLILMRIPSLLAILACWPIARWCLRRTLGSAEPRVAKWLLASAFLLLAMGWTMTLRPEPFVSLLGLVILAAALSFVARPRTTPLVVMATAVPLAVTAHPAGVTTAAPVLAISALVFSAVRRGTVRVAEIAIAAIASVALTLVLLFLDTDLASWNEHRRLFEHSTYYSQPWWEAFTTYTKFLGRWDTPIRHLSLAILLIAVLGYLTRERRGAGAAVSVIPARSVMIALLLLLLVPGKSPHWGAFAGLGAVAAAAEGTRLYREARQPGGPQRRPLRPFLATLLIAGAAVWAASRGGQWASFDIQTTKWTDALSVFQPQSAGDLLPWLAVGVAAVVAAVITDRRRRRRGLPEPVDVPWKIAAWALPVATAPIIAVTLFTLARDARDAPQWAPARQHLSALLGRDRCGLGEIISLHENSEARPALRKGPLAESLTREGVTAIVQPGVSPYFPCAESPSIQHGVGEVPDLFIDWPTERAALKRESSFSGLIDLFAISRLDSTTGLAVWEVDRSQPGAATAPATRRAP
jgi:arabinosyltransferase C